MGFDVRQSQAKRRVLAVLQSEAFKSKHPYGASRGEIAAMVGPGIGDSYLSEILGYLRLAGLAMVDKQGRHMATDSGTVVQTVTTATLTSAEMERVQAGLPSTGPLTADQQRRLELFRKKQA